METRLFLRMRREVRTLEGLSPGGGCRAHGPFPSEPSSESQVLSVAFLRVWLVLRVEGKLWRGGSLRGLRAQAG